MPRKAPRAARVPSPRDDGPAVPPPAKPAQQSAPQPAAPLLDRIRWDWLALAVSLLVLAWLATAGDWEFFPKAGFLESFFDAQARSLLDGRIDVPPEAIGTEAFVRQGKTYGYFGPTPALMRLPLEVLLPGMYGRWGVVSMLLASALTLGMLLLLMRRLESRFPAVGGPRLRVALRAVLILAAAIGSTNFFVSTEHKVYQESIIWSSALAFTSAVLLACYLMRPQARWLALACAAALLAFLARVSSGAGPLAALFLVDAALLLPFARLRGWFAGPEVPRRAAAALSVTLAVSAVLWGGLNYWKFGQVFTTHPIALNKQFDRERVERVKGELVSIYNLPLTVSSYLSPANIEFHRRFPWAFLTVGDPGLARRFPRAHFDAVEQFASLPAGMPELFLAAIAGTVLCLGLRRRELREFRAPVCGALAGCAVIFVHGFISYRYLHDTYPWLLVGSALAVAYLPSIPRQPLRRGLAGLFVTAAVYAMCVNAAFALRWQRFSCYPIPPEKVAAYRDLCSIADHGSLKGLLWYAWHWHRYIPPSSFSGGNVVVDRSQLAERADQPVILSQGPPPSGAEYDVDLPADGTYEIAIRYAAAEPRPIHLFVNGRDMKEVCAATTGGWLPINQRWSPAGLFQMAGGANRIGLASYGPFPPVSMLRIIRYQ